jgi:PIN domain nuclease of toxin-antitoxin system
MKYLIDTHIFLWLLFDPQKIPAKTIKILHDPTNHIIITSISFWEISLKYNLKKLELKGVTPDELPDLAEKMGLKIVEIGAKEMSSFHKLPKPTKHKDPFDRIIIWYSICNDYTFVSQDRKLGNYESLGLKVL